MGVEDKSPPFFLQVDTESPLLFCAATTYLNKPALLVPLTKDPHMNYTSQQSCKSGLLYQRSPKVLHVCLWISIWKKVFAHPFVCFFKRTWFTKNKTCILCIYVLFIKSIWVFSIVWRNIETFIYYPWYLSSIVSLRTPQTSLHLQDPSTQHQQHYVVTVPFPLHLV